MISHKSQWSSKEGVSCIFEFINMKLFPGGQISKLEWASKFAIELKGGGGVYVTCRL